MEDRMIPSGEADRKIKLRIFTPIYESRELPLILESHGGGWVGGNLDIENYRCIELAKRIPAIVVSVEYRLAGEGVCYPEPLKDCLAAYLWMAEHAVELGGDARLLGMHGTSAGGNLTAGLALYLRDHGGPKCALAVLNCAVLHLNITEMSSYFQNEELSLVHGEYAKDTEATYLGHYLGKPLPEYAFPGHAVNLRGLCPHFVLAAEYDTLRDSSVRYAVRLMDTGVPCELLVAPRVCHGFTSVHHPYTEQIHDLIATSFRREFGMLDQ